MGTLFFSIPLFVVPYLGLLIFVFLKAEYSLVIAERHFTIDTQVLAMHLLSHVMGHSALGVKVGKLIRTSVLLGKLNSMVCFLAA